MATVERRSYEPHDESKPWLSNAPLLEQVRSDRGEGYLMRIKDPDILRAILMSEVHSVPDAELVLTTLPFIHEGHKRQRRRNGDPYELHLLRGTIRDVQNPRATGLQLSLHLDHDIVEDCKKTEGDFIAHYSTSDERTLIQARLLFVGANALSNHRGGVKLKPSKYHHNIIHAHMNNLNSFSVIDTKLVDRNDNYLDDIVYVVDRKEAIGFVDKRSADRLDHYLPKAIVALEFGKRYVPLSPNTARLSKTIALATRLRREYRPF